MTDYDRRAVRDLLWITLWFLLLIVAGYGLRDPWPADEPRFALIARDMVASGHWLIPTVGSDLYQDKPPLHFWLMASAYAVIGSLRWSFLLPSMLASLGTLFLVYDIVRRLHGREAAMLAAVTLVCTLQFTITTRGAQIDATLVFFVTLSLWALLRHCLLQPRVWLLVVAGAAAGLGVIDKAVGFLALLLLPLAWLLQMQTGRDQLRQLAWLLGSFICTIGLWLLPMLWHVAESGSPALLAYRDELLFQQTVTRYTAAWHHLRPWHYFFTQVIPLLWLPVSALLFWLIPRWWRDLGARRMAVLLPLVWALLVVVFFSFSSGKRGVYVLPAVPALVIAASAHFVELYQRRGVARVSLLLGLTILVAVAALLVGDAVGWLPARRVLVDAALQRHWPLWSFLGIATILSVFAARFRAIWAWPLVLACLTVHWGVGVAPQLNGERSARDFMTAVLVRVPPGKQLGLVAYKEQFLLYVDRPTVNFGHARWREGLAEAYDAASWLAEDETGRKLLVPEKLLQPCFEAATKEIAGRSSDEAWWLVSGPPQPDCVRRGDPRKAIVY